MSFSLSLSRKRRLPKLRNAQNAHAEGGGFTWWVLGLFPVPFEGNAIVKTTPGKRACEGLSPCLSKKRQFQALLRALGFQAPLEGLGKLWQARLRWPFPPTCRRKVAQEEACKGVSWTFSPACRRKGRNRTSRALAIAFSPCLSRKRPSQGLGVRLQWPFPPACRGKGYHETCLSRTRLFQHTPSMFWSPQAGGLCFRIAPTV